MNRSCMRRGPFLCETHAAKHSTRHNLHQLCHPAAGAGRLIRNALQLFVFIPYFVPRRPPVFTASISHVKKLNTHTHTTAP